MKNPKKIINAPNGRFLWILVAFIAFSTLYYIGLNTKNRSVVSSPNIELTEPKEPQEKGVISPKSSKENSGKTPTTPPIPPGDEEWCEALEYKDLSNDPVFAKFERWMDEFKTIDCELTKDCTIHDPRYLRSFFNRGLALSRTRASVLQKIIRGDPKTALRLAIDEADSAKLPKPIRDNLESMEQAFVDFEAMHVCFDSQHPMGYIKRWVTLPDGVKKRAWVYGKRKGLTTKKGLAVWGISLGDDFAMSEDPYRIVSSEQGDDYLVLGDQKIDFEHDYEKRFMMDEITNSERRSGLISHTIRYPRIASSTGLAEYIEKKYDLNTTLSTWSEAVQSANARNGHLVSIGSADENRIIWNLLQDASKGVSPEGQLVEYSWIGATDNEDQNGSTWDEEANQTSDLTHPIAASEGDWKWIAEGSDVSSGSYVNWAGETEPNNADRDFAAIDFGNADANWTDLNETYRLPFIIEYDNVAEPAALSTQVDGYRKVLVIPARFQDEGYNYNGSSAPLVDQFGNVLYPEMQKESFEPVAPANLARAMQQVKDFFLRNSDGTFHLEPVIAPTVTLPLPKYAMNVGGGTENLFDSSGNFVGFTEVDYDGLELADISDWAHAGARAEGDDWNMHGPAFFGVSSVSIAPGYNQVFTEAPVVSFSGGNIAGGLIHPNFSPARAEAIMNTDGTIASIKILDTGAYYYSQPDVLINGTITPELGPNTGSVLASWVVITTYGGGGLGFVGAQGSYVAASGGSAGAGVIAHELGHNFGLWHANTIESLSERPNSDEAIKQDYGNPYSVMGGGGISGDLTVPEKASVRINGNFGFDIGTTQGIDVARLYSAAEVTTSVFRDTDNEDLPENTFRIYRHDYGDAPLSLLESTFILDLPDEEYSFLNGMNTETFNLKIEGTGEGATGVLKLSENEIEILSGGLGYAEEPSLSVVDENETILITLDPRWIKVSAGTDSNITAALRNFSESAPRGIRGLTIPAADHGPVSYDYGAPVRLGAYWLEYRRSASEHGLSILLGSNDQDLRFIENHLMDMTMHTPGDFSDAFLMPGFTYSDYEADIHITTISKGGNDPMEYLNVAVNVGTVESGAASAPRIIVDANTKTPQTGEFVEINARLLEGNVKDYAFSWFLNEVPETDIRVLNQPTFIKSFDKAGEYVVRVVVSDLKGGLSSKNIVIQVGDYHSTDRSIISGTVRSGKGGIQGARVVVEKAPFIEHTVSLAGSLSGTFLPNADKEPLRYLIDGVEAPDLVLRRGEHHRFYFDASTNGIPMSFFSHPEHEMPTVSLKMLVTPRVDQPGDNYLIPPEVHLSGGSAFANYLSHEIGTIADYQADLIGDPANPLVVTRPFAKTLLQDTNITSVRVRPTEKDEYGLYLNFGGKGYDRENAPNTFVHRTSFWEDYTDTNASVSVEVDGVGTISPVNSESFLGGIWQTRAHSDPLSPAPTILVWGTGSDSNATIEQYTAENGLPHRRIIVHDQGANHEPNGTMAIIHYPLDPFAQWSFDIHESLFDDATQSRFQPSPAWNNPVISKLDHYWSFDEASGTTITDGQGSVNITVAEMGDLSDENVSVWGVLGRALKLDGSTIDFNATLPVAYPYTFSAWLIPATGKLSFGGSDITYHDGNNSVQFGDAFIQCLSPSNQWTHLAIVAESANNGQLYVDGQVKSYGGVALSNLHFNTSDMVGLLDEVRIYSEGFTESQVKHLAGRLFLDVSGNRFHAAPIGPDFDMSDPSTDPGMSTERPRVNNGDFPGKLGDSSSGDNHGRSLQWDDNDSYIDLSDNVRSFAGLNEGTISFWICPEFLDEDMTVFSASNTDDNQSFFRIMVRDIGVMQLHVVNDGAEVARFYTPSDKTVTHNGSPTMQDWHHVVLVVDQAKSEFWIDGQLSQSLEYADGAGARRAFFSDVENVNFMAIGRHETSEANATNSYTGWMDDFYIYDRPLTSDEINFLYELRKGREQIPLLEAVVDSISTVNISDAGEGYKETPEVVFSYGSDANTTDQLVAYDPTDTPKHGTLAFDQNESLIMVYHDSIYDDGWRIFEEGFGLAELNASSVDRILWTKDTGTGNALILPNDRNITRRYVEYVVEGNGSFPSPSEDFGAPAGLFGYNAPPEFTLDAAPSGTEHASGYALFFLDLNNSAVINNPGMGLNNNAFDSDIVRINGKGYRPQQTRIVSNTDFDGSISQDQIITSFQENWGRDENGVLTYNQNAHDGNPIIGLTNGNALDIDGSGVIFQDWTPDGGAREPRNVTLEFNKTMSHASISNAGYGYSLPVQISVIGGRMRAEDLLDYMTQAETENLVLPPPFRAAQIEVNSVDANGGIVDFNITDPGYGYAQQPEIIISGGGGYGAEAMAFVSSRFGFTIADTQISFGFIVDGLDTLRLEENASLDGGFFVDANTTSGVLRITYDDNETFSRLVDKLNDDTNATILAIYDDMFVPGSATLDGNGAALLADINVSVSRGVEAVFAIEPGRGYFNIDPSNTPEAALEFTGLANPEQNASLELRLGGSLSTIVPTKPNPAPKHMDLWIEIWDRNRTETDIDSNEDRAVATAKVRNGVIEKVVVINEGRGYVDPVVFVRGTGPKYIKKDGTWRQWRCLNMRETLSGGLQICGHIETGLYPPENCPGEEDDQFLATDERDDQAIQDWWDRHSALHKDCGVPYSADLHIGCNFKTRKCDGRKANFVLINDPYRTPYETWDAWDAQLVPLMEGGKIKDIVVLDGGQMYAALELAVSGTGGNVDTIPVFDEFGALTDIIFDDPDLFNVDRDNITRPLGAGQGFQERPWSWDGPSQNAELGGYRFLDNKPIYGPSTKGEILTITGFPSSQAYFDEFGEVGFSAPTLNDNLGDRIVDIKVRDRGLYAETRTVEGASITIDFNSSHRPDIDLNGSADFVPARAMAHSTYSLTGFILDENGTYIDANGADQDAGTEDDNRERSLYAEEPAVYLVPDLGAVDVDLADVTLSDFFRLNGLVEYDPTPGKGYFDLYVTDDLPDDFYYGFNSSTLPAYGGKITITDGLPGMNWATISTTETPVRSITSYTDINGFYAISDLASGLYNVTVLMEDKFGQEMTFRPDTNDSQVSRPVFIAGLPELVMESDDFGIGVSRLIWSRASREQSFPSPAVADEGQYELKTLEGIGYGFTVGSIPDLLIIPDPSNTSSVQPNIQMEVLVDGSLKFEIIDDVNSSQFNPGDKFTITYSSNYAGVDFRNDYLYAEIEDSSWAGIVDFPQYGSSRLVILPNDGNGSQAVEVPVYTELSGAGVDSNFTFQALAYDQDGNPQPTDTVNWKITLPFDDNRSQVASLSNQTGSSTELNVISTLRRGNIQKVEIQNNGANYSNGSSVKLIGSGVDFNGSLQVDDDGGIYAVTIHHAGSGYTLNDQFVIMDENGTGAILKPVLGGGLLTLEANMTFGGETLLAQVEVKASERFRLSDREHWLNLYVDSLAEKDSVWWQGDSDGDTLSNEDEFTIGTHPFVSDTDGDGLDDANETTGNLIAGKRVVTNPLLYDTDGDGLSDINETMGQTHPGLVDTDRDGLTDWEEYELGLDPTTDDPTATIGGIIFVPQNLAGTIYLIVEADYDPLTEPVFDASNPKHQQLTPSSFPYAFRSENNAIGKNYRITAFMDLVEDGSHETGEPIDTWEGTLKQNIFNANLILLDALPTLALEVAQSIEVERGETFPLAVSASDFPDETWTFGNIVAPRELLVTSSVNDVFLIDVDSGYASVNADAPYGTYQLTFNAMDSVGGEAEPLTREIIVTDLAAPVLTILNQNPLDWPYGTSWSPTALIYYAVDEVDGNLTANVDIEEYEIDVNLLGTTVINLSVRDDFGNLAEADITVEVKDMSAPVISFTGADEIDLMIGDPFELPSDYASVTDNYDNDTLLTTQLQVDGLDEVDPEVEGNYSVVFSVTDSSGNLGSKELIVRVKSPAHTIAGVAVDGYLNGSNVVFIPTNPSASDFEVIGLTDENGSFYLDFSESEFNATDANGNGVLDPDEGTISVSGGVDTATNKSFAGVFTADANATVVSPLSTVIHGMVDAGIAKSQAMETLATSLGYSNTLDITHYDPIANAGLGDEDAKGVLLANSLIANVLKQAEAFASIDSSYTDDGEASLSLAKQLGFAAFVNDSNLSTSLLSVDFIGIALEAAFNDSDLTMPNEENALENFASIAVASNQAFLDLETSELLPGELASSLAKLQLATEEEILSEYDRIQEGASSLSSLKSTTTADKISNAGESFVGVNLYAPVGNSFALQLTESDWQNDKALTQLFVSDADGDVVEVSITEGNEDMDGDGRFPFTLSATYELLVGDADDLANLDASEWRVTFLLSDGNGKETKIFADITNGVIESEEPIEVEPSSLSVEEQSFEISVSSNQYQAGAVIANAPTSSNQLATTSLSIISGNLDVDGDGVGVFRVDESNRIVVGDFDDLKALSAEELTLTLEGATESGSSYQLDGKIKIDNALSLESERLSASNWLNSGWFGDFYSTGGEWIYHSRLGWVFLRSDAADGYWFWDMHLESWLWTNPSNFPYFYKYHPDQPRWLYIKIEPENIRVYDFESENWSVRP